MDSISDILSRLVNMPSLVDDRFLKCLHFEGTEWCHAIVMTMAEARDATSGPPERATGMMIALLDKHLLLSQSSFAGLVDKAEDLPISWGNALFTQLVSGGTKVKADGSCHSQQAFER